MSLRLPWRMGLIPALLAGAGLATSAPTVTAGDAPVSTLTIVERALAQDQGHWQVDYTIRHDGPTGVIVIPTEVSATVEGWVSNSRVAGHDVPKRSTLVVSGASGGAVVTDLIVSADESKRCRERAVLVVWEGDVEPPPTPAPATSAKPDAPVEAAPRTIVSLAPGATLRARLRLEHQHVVYGDYDPLLGVRQVELRLGSAVLRDVLPLDREQYLARAKGSWPEPTADRRDNLHFLSAPDSLHLEAHVPGNGYYRFPERPVRYATKMRLRFWYLTAPGTQGECRARIAQYKETPTAWKVLTDGCHEDTLSTVGRWVKVERIFRTEPDATTLALDFRIAGAEVGEMWIDDISLEPVCEGPGGP